jgi:hypothetical protein
MHETALSQVYTLCDLASLSSSSPSGSTPTDNEVRARIFWYAYLHEAITIGLQGGRLIFDDDDLAVFQASSPHIPLPIAVHSSTPPSLPSPVSPTFPSPLPNLPYDMSQYHHEQMPAHRQQGSMYQHEEKTYASHSRHAHQRSEHSPVHHPHLLSAHVFALPLHVSALCRRVHCILTGPKARRAGTVNEQALFQLWESLKRCWDEFESLRRNGAVGVGDKQDIERFVAGWQIRIFDCCKCRRCLFQNIVDRLPSQTTSFVNR